MQDFVTVTGMVIKVVPSLEYDRRLEILTVERGKISAFAKGARKVTGKLTASTDLFAFGKFKLYEGKTSYSVIEADISNYFEFLRTDFIASSYAMYFLEMMDYYTRENNDEKDMLGLLYQSVRALENEKLDDRLIKCIFELKTLVIEGEYPPIVEGYKEATLYTLEYISKSPLERLYTFVVDEQVLTQLESICSLLMKKYVNKSFKSLEILEEL